jgi:hypothetical protein
VPDSLTAPFCFAMGMGFGGVDSTGTCSLVQGPVLELKI